MSTTNIRQSLTHEAVQTLQVREALTVGPDVSVGTAIARMRERGEGCVIITEHGKPIGVFTERDVLVKFLGDGGDPTRKITEMMTGPPQVAVEGCTVASVIRQMHAGGFRHVPVVDGDGLLRGVVSVKRVVEYLVEHFPEAVLNLPPEPGQKQTAREGA